MSVEFEELNEELEGLPAVIGMSKLFLKHWDLLNQNYDELTATRKINAVAMDVTARSCYNIKVGKSLRQL